MNVKKTWYLFRTEFENVAKGRLSEIGELEMYIPWYSLVWRYTLACIIVLLVVKKLLPFSKYIV